MRILARRRRSEDALERMRHETGAPPAPVAAEPEARVEAPVHAARPLLARVAVLVAVGLTVALRAVGHGHDEPRPVHGVPPYSFIRPAGWVPDPHGEQAAKGSLDNVTGLQSNNESIVVGSFIPTTQERIEQSLVMQYRLSGGQLRSKRDVTVDKIEGVELYASGNGVQDRTTILFASPTAAYWINCLSRGELEHTSTRRACDTVLRTFRLER